MACLLLRMSGWARYGLKLRSSSLPAACVGRPADQLGLAGLHVPEEHVPDPDVAVRCGGHRRRPGNEPAIGSDRALVRGRARLGGRPGAHPSRGRRGPVGKIDPSRSAGEGCDVGRTEHDEAAGGTDRRRTALGVALDALALHAHPTCRAGRPVADEHVADPVVIPRHQIGRPGEERHVSGITADVQATTYLMTNTPTRAVSQIACSGSADQFCGPGLQVAHEHVGRFVRVCPE